MEFKKDKVQHITAGAIIALVTYFTVLFFFKSKTDAFYISIFMATLIGYLKEKYDVIKENPTGFDKIDLLATFLGGLVMALIISIF